MHMKPIVNKPRILLSLCCAIVLASCDDNSSEIINDTGIRLFLEMPESKKCYPANDYIEISQQVHDPCRVSETASMKLTDSKGNICNVDMDDLRKKIVIKPIGDAWGGKYEELSLSKLNCPNLGLPILGVPEAIN